MERSEFREIDHLVLPVTTLALARSRLTSLGFTVAPDARHPFGTGNCCVFFKERNFLEPVTILDRAAADMAAAEGVIFVKRLKRFTERNGEGFAMVAMKSGDAAADLTAFEQGGLAAGPLFRFARMATLPDGSEREIGFALAFADAPALPDATFFACQHLAPGALFQPAFVEHPNGALGVASVTAVAHLPSEFTDLLAAFGGAKPDSATTIHQENVPVQLTSPENYLARYGVEPPDPRRGFVLAAIDLTVSDLDLAVGFAGPTAIRHEGRIVVPPSPGLGATLAFGTHENG